MTSTSGWESTAVLVAVLAPLVGIPLTALTFYLRSLREQQAQWFSELSRRCDAADAGLSELRRRLVELERDYATKEEWLRETMHARRTLEHLTSAAARLDAKVMDLAATLAAEQTTARGPAPRFGESVGPVLRRVDAGEGES
ncbi:MAG: hypothetical protein AABZ12_10650 [Planctomycetota bacterium]